MEEIDKKCYEYCNLFNYDKEKIVSLAMDLGVSYQDIIDRASRYAGSIVSDNLWGTIYRLELSCNIPQEVTRWIKNDKRRLDYYLRLGEEDYNEFLKMVRKDCFDHAYEVGFSSVRIKEYSKEIGLSEKRIKDYAKEYYLNDLGKTYEEYLLMIENFLLEKKIDMEEKRGNTELKKLLDSSVSIRELYTSLGEGTYSEFVLKLGKHFYEYAKGVSFNRDRVLKYVKELNIPYRRFNNYAKRYATSVLGNDSFKLYGWNNAEIDKKCDEEKAALRRKKIYEYAEMVDYDVDKLNELAISMGIYYNTLMTYLYDYFRVDLDNSSEELDKKKMEIRRIRNESQRKKELEKWLEESRMHEMLYTIFGKDYALYEKNMAYVCHEFDSMVEHDMNEIRMFCKYYQIYLDEFKRYIERYKDDDNMGIITDKELLRAVIETRINEYAEISAEPRMRNLSREIYEYTIMVKNDINKIRQKALRLNMSLKAYYDYFYEYMDDVLGYSTSQRDGEKGRTETTNENDEVLENRKEQMSKLMTMICAAFGERVNFDRKDIVGFCDYYMISYQKFLDYVKMYNEAGSYNIPDGILKVADDLVEIVREKRKNEWINGSNMRKMLYERVGCDSEKILDRNMARICTIYGEGVNFSKSDVISFCDYYDISYQEFLNYVNIYEETGSYDIPEDVLENVYDMVEKVKIRNKQKWVKGSSIRKMLYEEVGCNDKGILDKNMARICANFGKRVGWVKQEIIDFCNYYDMSYQEFMKYAKKYDASCINDRVSIEVLKMAIGKKLSVDSCKKKIREKIN